MVGQGSDGMQAVRMFREHKSSEVPIQKVPTGCLGDRLDLVLWQPVLDAPDSMALFAAAGCDNRQAIGQNHGERGHGARAWSYWALERFAFFSASSEAWRTCGSALCAAFRK